MNPNLKKKNFFFFFGGGLGGGGGGLRGDRGDGGGEEGRAKVSNLFYKESKYKKKIGWVGSGAVGGCRGLE